MVMVVKAPLVLVPLLVLLTVEVIRLLLAVAAVAVRSGFRSLGWHRRCLALGGS